MAGKALKPCAVPGCRNLTASGYCDAHADRRAHRRSAEAGAYHRLYSLPAWDDRHGHGLRPMQLLREPYCRMCAERARREQRPELARVPAVDVDHVTPHRGRLSLFLDASNLQSLCHSCHAVKTAAEQRERGR